VSVGKVSSTRQGSIYLIKYCENTITIRVTVLMQALKLGIGIDLISILKLSILDSILD